VNSSATRRPRLKRTRHGKPSFVMQERDLSIIKLVADYGIASSDIITALVLGSRQVLLRRLQVLYHAGHLDRPRRQQLSGNGALVYALGSKGASIPSIVTDHRGRDWSEKNRKMQLGYIEHQLMMSRFRAILQLAGRDQQVEIESWRQGNDLWDSVLVEHSDHIERIPVAPDAHFVLRLSAEPEGQNRIHVFLEADRSTMTVKRFVTKLRGYWWYWRTGRLEEKFGVRNALVLTLTRSHERAQNLANAAAMVDPPRNRGLRTFLFGSEQGLSLEVPGEILGRRWRTPADSILHSLME